jgi:acetyl/propionyl-CoA carboxylase alpha subunit
MRRALAEYEIDGIKTTLPFFREVLEDREFVSGELDTGFIGRFTERRVKPAADEAETDIAAIAAALAFTSHKAPEAAQPSNGTKPRSRWATFGKA